MPESSTVKVEFSLTFELYRIKAFEEAALTEAIESATSLTARSPASLKFANRANTSVDKELDCRSLVHIMRVLRALAFVESEV